MATNGWSELGAMMAGGDSLQRQRLGLAALEAGSRQAALLEDASAKRATRMGLQSLTPELMGSVTSGRDPITGEAFDPSAAASLQGQVLSGMLRSGIDPRQLSGYVKEQQGNDFQRQAWDARNGDIGEINRMLMVMDGKPVQIADIKDGIALNPYVAPDQQALNPTAVGLADIMAKRASANASNAQARLNDTQAAAGGWNPRGSAENDKPSLPATSLLGALLGQSYDPGTGLVGIPHDKAQDFLAWQRRMAEVDPRYNNGSFAVGQYAAHAPLGSGIDDSPEDVGAVDLGRLRDAPLSVSTTSAARAAPAASSAPSAKKRSAPTPGTSEGGYVFKGGDPSNPANWVKLSALRESAP